MNRLLHACLSLSLSLAISSAFVGAASAEVSTKAGSKDKRAELGGSAPLQSDPLCPAPGNIGIFHADEFEPVISQNMRRDIELCADLLFSSGPYIMTGTSGIPGDNEVVYGFQGRLLGNGHKITVPQAADPRLQRGVSLGFHEIGPATIQDLVLEVPGQGVGDDASTPSYIIGYRAGQVTIRNIELRKITTSAGLFGDAGANLAFDNIRGDITMRPLPGQRSIGAVTTECANCSFNNLNLSIRLDPQDLAGGPPYSGGPTYVGGLVAFGDRGFVRVTNSVLSGSIKRGFDRGMIAGALWLDGSSYPDGDGNLIEEHVLIDNVRVVNSDLDQEPGYDSNIAGLMIGHATGRVEIQNSLVRDSRVSSSSTAGGLVGGGSALISKTGLENVHVLARNSAAGMVANNGAARIEDSYFRGTVTQDAAYGSPVNFPGVPAGVAGGLVNYGDPNLSIRNVYVSAAVHSFADQPIAGAVVGIPVAFERVENAYYDQALTPDVTGVGTPLNSFQMLTASSYAGFDAQVWRLEDGKLPRLASIAVYTLQDLFNFLSLYFAQDARADYNLNGSIDTQDIFDFLESYFSRS